MAYTRQGQAVAQAGKTAALINNALQMDGTKTQRLARKLRNSGNYNRAVKLGELYVQMARDGGDMSFILEGTEAEKTGIDNSLNDGITKTLGVYRGVGASGKNYSVRLPGSRQHTKPAEGKKIEGVVFAGKGTDTEIRDRFLLEVRHRIPAKEWQKVSGKGFVLFKGKNRPAELHWYEAKGEIYDMKIKRYLDES